MYLFQNLDGSFGRFGPPTAQLYTRLEGTLGNLNVYHDRIGDMVVQTLARITEDEQCVEHRQH